MNRVEIRRKQIQNTVQLVWVITWLILSRVIGYRGIAYLAVAIEGMTFFLTLIAERLPDSMGKILRSRYMKEQYKNAHKVKQSVLLFQTIIAVLSGLLLFFFAGFLTTHGMLAMRVLAPVIILRVLSNVLLGYFQGRGTQMPTILISLLRQILYLCLGVPFANHLKVYGEKVQQLLLNDVFASMYGSVGFAAGMLITELLLLIFAMILYFGSRKKEKEQSLKQTETFTSAISSLYGNMAPAAIIDFLARMPIWLGLLFYFKTVEDSASAAAMYGGYYVGYVMICAVPVLIISNLFHTLSARTITAVKKSEAKLSKELAGTTIHGGFVVSLIISVGFAVFHKQIAEVLTFGSGADFILSGVSKMLCHGSAIIVMASMSIIMVRILLYLGKIRIVLCSLMGYLIVFVIGSQLCLRVWKLDVESLVYASLASSTVLCLTTVIFVIKIFRIKIDLLYWIVIPIGACAVAGLISYGFQSLLTPHLGSITTILAGLLLALVIYWVILILLRSFRRQELERLTGAKVLLRICEMTGINL